MRLLSRHKPSPVPTPSPSPPLDQDPFRRVPAQDHPGSSSRLASSSLESEPLLPGQTMPVLPNAARSASGRFSARTKVSPPQATVPSAPSSVSSTSSPHGHAVPFDSRHLPISPPPSDTDTDSKTPAPKSNGRGRSGSTKAQDKQDKRERQASGDSGRGFGGFIRRSLSRTRDRRGSKGDADRPAPEEAPPVPELPPALLQLSLLDIESVPRAPVAAPVVQQPKALAPSVAQQSVLRGPSSNVPEPSPADEMDLASLLHLVHAAGDMFADSPAPSTPPNQTASAWSSPTTPALSVSGSRSSPESALNTTPRPYFSFLSHLDPGPSASAPRPFALTPAASGYQRSSYIVPKPAPLRTQAKEQDSDDEYGRGSMDSDEDDSRGGWANAKRTNAPFRKASGAVMNGPQPPVSPTAKKPELGPMARTLFEGTHARLASPVKDGAQRPASTASAGTRAFGMGVVLGRIAVDRKLRRGTTMLEAMEIENRRGHKKHQASVDSQASTDSSAASFSSAKSKSFGVPSKKDLKEDPRKRLAPISLRTALDTLFHAGATRLQPTKAPISRDSSAWVRPRTEADAASPERPAQLPTRAGLDKWLRRASFADRKLVTTAIEGGVLLDLVRNRPRQPPLEFSPRIRELARAGLDDVPVTPTRVLEDRPVREARPTASAATTKPVLPVIITKPNKRLVLPGPLLLAALANGTLSEADIPPPSPTDSEEDLPLAVLQSRSPEVAAAAAAALKQAQEQAHFAKEKAFELEAEIGRLRTNELIRQERQERMDEERVDRERMKEIHRVEEMRETELRRRQAEQRRRSRAAGQFDMSGLPPGTPPSSPPDHSMRRSVSQQSLSPDRPMRRPVSFHSLKRTSMTPKPPIQPLFQPTPWNPSMLAVPGPYGLPPGMMMPPPQMGMPSPQMGQMGYYDGSQRGSLYGAPAFAASAPSLNPFFNPLVASPLEYHGQQFPSPPIPSSAASHRMPQTPTPSRRMSYSPSPAGSARMSYSPQYSPNMSSPPVTPPRAAVHRGGSVTVSPPDRPPRRRPVSGSSTDSTRQIGQAARRSSPPREPPRRGQSVPDPYAPVRLPDPGHFSRSSSSPQLENKAGSHAFLAAATAKRTSLLPPTTMSPRGVERRVSFVSFT